jgi:hypothetical protein
MICACAIAISLASYHFNRDVDYNEVNPGFFIQKENLVGFAYWNSNRRLSVGVAGAFDVWRKYDVAVSVLAGVGSGYHLPVVGGVRLTVGRHQIFAVPPTKYNSATVAYAYLLQP